MFENEKDRKVETRYYLPKVQIKKFNAWWKKVFFQTDKSSMKTYDSIWKITTRQVDDYTTDCLLDYNYYNMKSIDLRKQQPLGADQKSIQ